jgi:hypothetical protein
MVYTSYIRINGKWHKVGKYYTKCKQFDATSPKEETFTTNKTLASNDSRVEQTDDNILNDIVESVNTKTVPGASTNTLSDENLVELCNSLGKS